MLTDYTFPSLSITLAEKLSDKADFVVLPTEKAQ
jgi:hypothetical protein